MPNVIPFTPRPRPIVPTPVQPFAGLDLRVQLEEAAQIALDAADKIIAALDRIEGADGIEPAVPDPPHHAAMSTIVRNEGAPASVSEGDVSTIVRPEGDPEPEPIAIAQEISLPPIPLRWHGAGNIVSALGIAALALVVRA